MSLSIDLVFLVLTLISAFLALAIQDLLISAIMLGVFSYLAALVYSSMGAVDVGFNEAVLGAGITGFFFVAAIYHTQRYIHGRYTSNKFRLKGEFHFFPLILVLCLGLILAWASLGMPHKGEVFAPANQHISPDYIRMALPKTHTPNIVTAMIADFRAFDTLGETFVVFVAALCSVLILGHLGKSSIRGQFLKKTDNPIVELGIRLMVPFIQLFAFYVISHGHYSPGGGFQGGALLGASMLLQRLFLGEKRSEFHFPLRFGLVMAAIGLFVFAGLGLLTMLGGGAFLDYSYLPFMGIKSADLRSIGILLVELGVALTVAGSMVIIFDNLAHEAES